MTHTDKAKKYFEQKYHCSQAVENNLFTEVCPNMVVSAVKILEQLFDK